MNQQIFTIQDIQNGTLSAKNAMPQKDITSDGTSSFEMGRAVYRNRKMPATTIAGIANYNKKKLLGNRDSSAVTTARRNDAIGRGSTITTPFSFTTHKSINTINDAIRRVRAGGAVAPPIKGAFCKNGTTPSFYPHIPSAYAEKSKANIGLAQKVPYGVGQKVPYL
jgi:hypothetical protein